MIRPAVVADAAAITHAHVGGWLAAYRGIMPDDVLDNLDFEARRARWHDNLANGARVLIDECDGVVRGFSGFGPCRDEDKAGAGEVYALYVDQQWWGQGVGEALLSAALDALRAEGYTEFVLWVLRDNARARRFYEKQGWRFDGTEQVSQWGPVESRHVYQATA
jgi:GNAT superfamily N-acetyltransferase